MAQKYNPLLKFGFQETESGAIADLQAAISSLQIQAANLQNALNALKGNKITKVTAAAQLPNIAVGEIFEWQAESQTVDGVDFVNGYFYKSNGATITVTPPVPYIAFTNDFPQNQPYQLGDYNFVFGNYYQVKSYNIDVSNLYTYAYVDNNNTYRFIALKPINSSGNVGDVIFDRVLNIPETITAVDAVNHTATTDNGQIINISGVSSSYMLKLWQIGNADGSQSFYMLEPNSHMYYLLVHWDFENNTIIDFFPFQCLRYTSNTPYNFNTVAFSQTDTQPRIQGVENAQDGSLVISCDVEFSGDITVHGTQTIVDTQEIDSENDFINLRVNNPLALAEDEMSGLSVKNYDGNGNNLNLVVDQNGWARVGDENGTLQKLATIEENPTDGEFVKYNTTTKQLESGTIPTPSEATTTTAGLMSAADKDKLNGIATGAQVNPTVSTTTQSGINCAKYGRLCFLSGSLSTGQNTITLPATYKPANWVYFTAIGSAASTAIFICGGYINPSTGVLSFNKPILSISGNTISFNPTSFPVTFSVSYLAAS